MSESARIEVGRAAWLGRSWLLGSLASPAIWWARVLPAAAEANATRYTADPPPLADLIRRLRPADEPEWRFPVLTSVTLDGIESAEQVLDACVEDGPPEPVRSYDVDGHDGVRIVVPERYAAQLDAVRAWRLRHEAGRSADDLPPLDRRCSIAPCPRTSSRPSTRCPTSGCATLSCRTSRTRSIPGSPGPAARGTRSSWTSTGTTGRLA